MFTDWINPDLFAIGLLGVGAPLLGLVGLLARRPSPWHRRATGVTALALGGLSAAAAGGGLPQAVWLAPALLGGLCGLLLVLGSPQLGWGCARLLALARLPRLPWMTLLAAGPLLVLVWLHRLDAGIPPFAPGPGYEPAHQRVMLTPAASSPAFSDAGRPVALYHPARNASAEEVREAETYVVTTWDLAGQAIRVAPAGEECNCHGWIFAGGRYWIQSTAVQVILQDNGYHLVSEPQPNDLIVYRDDTEGQVISHSGIVRGVLPDGTVLVESKIGRAGRFIRAPDVVRYGSSQVYYRSARAGHRLRGLDDAPSE